MLLWPLLERSLDQLTCVTLITFGLPVRTGFEKLKFILCLLQLSARVEQKQRKEHFIPLISSASGVGGGDAV